ncbi:glycosyltransferase [Azoarcus communis]|uniref:glycosyltransferase family 2 protein n=1 Tax=Parazoarcus communis TaxID=41977 RepID=UPI001459C293|nr:glycosyltransferase [Parazoarcus communis]NMG47404.1 glycosyltransferase [Parazoarcus communis]
MKISVVIPTYNRRHQIGGAIDSALSQVCETLEVEVIVVDDGSSDGTVAWLDTAYAGQPVRILSNARGKGPAGARNTGILAVQGELVALLDSDDQFLPGHLAAAARLFRKHPDVGLVFGRAQYEQDGVVVDYMGPNFDRKLALAPRTDEDEETIIFTPAYSSHLLEYGCYFNLSSVVMRAEFARSLMTESLRIAEDFEFWVRLSRQTTFACLKNAQIRYQLHGDNISFEAAASAADHAPYLIKAYETMLGYSGLSRTDQDTIHRHLAQTLFDWAYRCRLHGRLGEAMALHVRSARLGLRRRNLMAVVKLAVQGLLPSNRNRH